MEEIIRKLVTPVDEYATVQEALAAIADARQYQLGAWTNTVTTDAGGRPYEEWQVLLHHYLTKLDEVYTVSDGRTEAGRARVAKYAAIVGNLALWLVQAAQGRVQGQGQTPASSYHDGCTFHTSSEPGLTGEQGKDSIGS